MSTLSELCFISFHSYPGRQGTHCRYYSHLQVRKVTYGGKEHAQGLPEACFTCLQAEEEHTVALSSLSRASESSLPPVLRPPSPIYPGGVDQATTAPAHSLPQPTAHFPLPLALRAAPRAPPLGFCSPLVRVTQKQRNKGGDSGLTRSLGFKDQSCG